MPSLKTTLKTAREERQTLSLVGTDGKVVAPNVTGLVVMKSPLLTAAEKNQELRTRIEQYLQGGPKSARERRTKHAATHNHDDHSSGLIGFIAECCSRAKD